MERIATTFRIDPVLKEGLTRLSRLKRQTLNQLVNEALREFVAKRTAEVEVELESTLEDLRTYRKSDPDFDRAIAEFIESEATAESDPAEGRVISDGGPAQSRVRKLLND